MTKLLGRKRLMVAGLSLAAVGILAAAVVRGGDEGGLLGPRRVKATLPAGTTLVGSLGSRLSTEGLKAGRPVTLTTRNPLELGDDRALPAGVIVRGEVTHAKGGGRIAGAPELTIRFREISVGGSTYPISAEPFRLRGKDDLVESVAEIGGGAVVGGIVGAVAGSTVKGAVIGGVLGTGVAVATKGNQIVLPAGQRIRVRLTEPVRVSWRPVSEPDPDKDN
jgi:hypothetical protein